MVTSTVAPKHTVPEDIVYHVSHDLGYRFKLSQDHSESRISCESTENLWVESRTESITAEVDDAKGRPETLNRDKRD